MRIIEETPQEQIHVCNNCGCKFAYDEDDTYSSPYGIAVLCPQCGKDVTVSQFDRVLQFPDAYFHFGNATKMTDKTIETWVKQCMQNCIKNNGELSYIGCGDSVVFVYQSDEDGALDIVIAKNYYSTTINREDAKQIINFS